MHAKVSRISLSGYSTFVIENFGNGVSESNTFAEFADYLSSMTQCINIFVCLIIYYIPLSW